MKIGLFYGSTTCYTEMAAEKIQQYFIENSNIQPELQIELFNIKDSLLSKVNDFDIVMVSCKKIGKANGVTLLL